MPTKFILIRHAQSIWNEAGRWQGHADLPLGEALGLRPTIDPIWRESGIGEWEGLTTEEIAARYPEIWATRTTGPMSGIPGAEGSEAVTKRAAAGCATLIARHPDETVAVVSHAGMILATLVHLLGLPPSGFAILTGGAHTAINQVLVDNGHTRLIGLNDAAHLELI